MRLCIMRKSTVVAAWAYLKWGEMDAQEGLDFYSDWYKNISRTLVQARCKNLSWFHHLELGVGLASPVFIFLWWFVVNEVTRLLFPASGCLAVNEVPASEALKSPKVVAIVLWYHLWAYHVVEETFCISCSISNNHNNKNHHFQPCVVLENVCLARRIQNEAHNANTCQKEADAIASEEALEKNSSIWFVGNTTIWYRLV